MLTPTENALPLFKSLVSIFSVRQLSNSLIITF